MVRRFATAGVLTLLLGLSQPVGAKVAPGQAQGPKNQRVLSIVAHSDDDLLFINPRIQQAIDSTAIVKTIVLTTGAPCTVPDKWSGDGDGFYALRREEGLRQAYAHMAGVTSRWKESREAGVSTFRLAGSGNLTVTFLRLPEYGDWDEHGSDPCPSWGSLKSLWAGERPSISDRASDIGLPSTSYTAEQLVSRLAAEIAAFRPTLILTLDPTDRTEGTQCHTGDHPDHRYTARFADAAISRSESTAAVEHHRGYNIASDGVNLTGDEIARKRAAFDAYGVWDWGDQHHPDQQRVIPAPAGVPFLKSRDGDCNERWTERRYLR